MLIIGNNSQGSNDGNNTLTISHIVGNNNDRILIVGVYTRDTNAGKRTVSTMIFNGVAMTSMSLVVEGSNQTEMWYLLNPEVGTFDVVITIGGNATNFSAGVVDVYDAMLQSAEAVTPNNVTTNTITTNATSISGQSFVLSSVVSQSVINPITHGGGQTEILQLSSSQITGSMSYKFAVVAGSQSMQESQVASPRMAQIVAIFTSKHKADVNDVLSVLEDATIDLEIFLPVFDTVSVVEDFVPYLEINFSTEDSIDVAEDFYNFLDVLNFEVEEPEVFLITESISVVDLVVEVGVVVEYNFLEESNSLYLDVLNIEVFDSSDVTEVVSIIDLVIELGIVEDSPNVVENIDLFITELNVSVDDEISHSENLDLFLDVLNFEVVEPLVMLITEVAYILDLIIEVGVVAEYNFVNEFNDVSLEVLNVSVYDDLSIVEVVQVFDVVIELGVVYDEISIADYLDTYVDNLFVGVEEVLSVAESVALFDIVIELGIVYEDVSILEDVSLQTGVGGINVFEEISIAEWATVFDIVIELFAFDGVSIADVMITETGVHIGDDVTVSGGARYDNVSVIEDAYVSLPILLIDQYDEVVVTEYANIFDIIIELGIVYEEVSVIEQVYMHDIIVELYAYDDVSVVEDFQLYLDELFVSVDDTLAVVEQVYIHDIIVELFAYDEVTVTDVIGLYIDNLFISEYEDISVIEWANVWDIIVELYAEDNVSVSEYEEVILPLLLIEESEAITVSEFFSNYLDVLNFNVLEPFHFLITEHVDVLDLMIEIGVVTEIINVNDYSSQYFDTLYLEVFDSASVSDSFYNYLDVLNVSQVESLTLVEDVQVFDIVIELGIVVENILANEFALFDLLTNITVSDALLVAEGLDVRLKVNVDVYDVVSAVDLIEWIFLVKAGVGYPRVFEVVPRHRVFTRDKSVYEEVLL
ncbi:hypothetical protein ACFL2J_05565 [Candidatus Omnitrophota bacterium]